MERVHIVNSTLGKALGGAAGMWIYNCKNWLFLSHCREFQVSNIPAYLSLKINNIPLTRGLHYVYHIKLDYIVIFLCAWLLLVKERHKQVLTLKQHSYTFCVSFVFSGGYTVGPKPLIELLRQRSRPYLFSNSLPPPVVACATRAVELLLASSEIAQSMTAKTMRYSV